MTATGGDAAGQAANSGLLASLSDGLAEAVARASVATVRVEARPRLGASGVLWPVAPSQAKGAAGSAWIVTADHVIEREEDIVVGLADGRSLRAALVGRDPGSDLALLKVTEKVLPLAEVAPQDGLRVGHLVLALGRPGEAGVTATLGIVSAIGGPWRSRRGGLVQGYVRSDVTMYPGFSGGPLVDTAGRVVAINSSWLAPALSLAIPAPVVDQIVAALLLRGHVRQGYLGVRTQQVDLPQALAQRMGQASGLLVMGVEPGGPADRAGMLLGDTIVALAGQPVRDLDDLQAQLGADRVGVAVQSTVLRGGALQNLTVTIGERH